MQVCRLCLGLRRRTGVDARTLLPIAASTSLLLAPCLLFHECLLFRNQGEGERELIHFCAMLPACRSQ